MEGEDDAAAMRPNQRRRVDDPESTHVDMLEGRGDNLNSDLFAPSMSSSLGGPSIGSTSSTDIDNIGASARVGGASFATSAGAASRRASQIMADEDSDELEEDFGDSEEDSGESDENSDDENSDDHSSDDESSNMQSDSDSEDGDQAEDLYDVIAQVKRNELKEVYLTDSAELSDEHLISLAAALLQSSRVTNVVVHGNGQVTRQGVAALVQAVQGHESVVSISLCDCNIGDQEVEDLLAPLLLHNVSIGRLMLPNNCIGDKGATSLAKAIEDTPSRQLELYLDRNRIKDDGAKSFARAIEANCNLNNLRLPNNEISDGGATALAKALWSNTIMTHLIIAHNSIGLHGFLAFAESLYRNPHLTWLGLGKLEVDKEVEERVAKKYLEAMKHNCNVINGCDYGGDIFFENQSATMEEAKSYALMNNILGYEHSARRSERVALVASAKMKRLSIEMLTDDLFICTSPHVLSHIGKRCNVAAMYGIVRQRPDILEHAGR